MRYFWVVIACLITSSGDARATSPPQESDLIRINVYCTTCDDFIRCQSDERGYTLYRLRAKTFWAQIATIWDYLIARIRPKTTDTRPLTVYLAEDGRKEVLRDGLSARVDLARGVVVLPDSLIDMKTGGWRTDAGVLQGRCVTVPRRDGYAFVREVLGRPLSEIDAS